MVQWLENFACKTTIGIVPFALAALVTVIIGILTVSFQSYKSATADSVRSLRNE
ncbi:MAG: hypothetical protein ACNS60_02750 [Candidatus Cyclobacteriaceae bacterium M2_1C_046]